MSHSNTPALSSGLSFVAAADAAVDAAVDAVDSSIASNAIHCIEAACINRLAGQIGRKLRSYEKGRGDAIT